MKEHRAVFYIDASVRFLTSDTPKLNAELLYNCGFISFGLTYYTTYMITHPGMYRYLPTDLRTLKRQESMPISGALLYCNTEEIFNEILYWYYLCSLDANCIAPPGSFALPRHPRGEWKGHDVWAGIHRYDLSALSILIFNFISKRNMTITFVSDVLAVRRDDVSEVNVTTCSV